MPLVQVNSDEDRSCISIQADLVDPLKGSEWDLLVSTHPLRTVFHGSGWAKLLNRTYHHEPFYLKIQREGKVIALIPLMQVSSPLTGRRGVCLPFSDFCSPLLWSQNDFPEIQEVLVNLARQKGWRYFELRGGEVLTSLSQSHGAYRSHQIDLSKGVEGVEERMASATRRCVRKAMRYGLQVKIGSSLGCLQDYQHLHVLTRKRHGVPPQPPAFFRNLHEEILDKDAGCVVLAYDKARLVAGAVFLWAGNHAVYKFGASDANYWSLRPNHLVMWSAIQTLVAQGCRVLDLGRTAISNDGLSHFKSSWGGDSAMIGYHRYGLKDRAWLCAENHREGGVAIFRWMPKTLSRIAGRFLYPHMD